jgi:hypothetical protein
MARCGDENLEVFDNPKIAEEAFTLYLLLKVHTAIRLMPSTCLLIPYLHRILKSIANTITYSHASEAV